MRQGRDRGETGARQTRGETRSKTGSETGVRQGRDRGETGARQTRGETRSKTGSETGARQGRDKLNKIILGFRVPTTCGKKNFDYHL